MIETLFLVVPFFGVIATGYIGASRISEAGQDGINNFVLYFALPVLIFASMAQSNLAANFQYEFVLSYTVVSVAMFTLTFMLMRWLFKYRRGESSVFAISAVYGNTGYMGIPIIVIALGSSAAVPVVISLMVDLTLMIPIAAAILNADRSNQTRNLISSIVSALSTIVKNPLVIAAVLGAAWSLSGFNLPIVIDSYVSLLGAAAAPCALFALGANLRGKSLSSDLPASFITSIMKLVIHPVALWITMTHWLEVSENWVKPAVLAAAMPVAATVFVISRQYKTMALGASSVVVTSTLLSLITLPIVMLLVSN